MSYRPIGALDAYWYMNPLDRRSYGILKDVATGRQVWGHNRFFEAHLIAIGCLDVDYAACRLTITEKGRHGLELFSDVYERKTTP